MACSVAKRPSTVVVQQVSASASLWVQNGNRAVQASRVPRGPAWFCRASPQALEAGAGQGTTLALP